ncbi:MAG: TetR family transcriptional regulator [Vicinamibacteria bacterium]
MTPSLQDRKRQLVRDAISHAAWALFADEGYEATTVDEIAVRAGVSRRTFFRYFSSKEDVAVGTSDAYAEDFLSAFRARPAREAPLDAIHHALRAMVLARAEDADEVRAIIRLLRESPTVRRAMLARNARMEERLAEVLAERLGADPRHDPTPALVAFVARALMDTAFNVWYDQQPADVGAMVDDLFRRLREVAAAKDSRPPKRVPRAPRRTAPGSQSHAPRRKS